MVALWNRADHYILILSFVLLLFSSPNLSRYRLDVCHISTHGVAKLPFAFRTRVGPMNHVLHEVQMPTWEGAILTGETANYCKV